MRRIFGPKKDEVVGGSRKLYNKELHCVRFEIFMAVTKKNDIFWDVTTCGSCKNRRFGGT
jgi:hypothetical protein